MSNVNEHFNFWERIVASGTGAIITSILVTPLDVVKIRLQAQRKPLANGECYIYCNGLMDHICQYVHNNKSSFIIPFRKKNVYFKNSFDACQKIIKFEGILSMWSGLSPTLISAIPQVIIYYTLNDWLKYIMSYNEYRCAISYYYNFDFCNVTVSKDDLIPPITGAVSRLVSQTVIAPLELIRTKMQSKKLAYSEVKKITMSAIKQGGILVLWRGLGPTMWRDMPYTVTLWFIYDFLKRRYLTDNCLTRDEILPHHLIFLYSTVGSIVAGIISHPFDVTKTHRQIELGNAMLQNKTISSSTWTYLRNLKKTEGYPSLFSGFFPRMIRVVIATSTMITIFESIKMAFIKYNKGHQIKNLSE